MTVRLSLVARAVAALLFVAGFSGCSTMHWPWRSHASHDEADAPTGPASPPATAAASPAVAPAPEKKPVDDLDLRYANGIVAVVEDHAITVEDVRKDMAPLVDEVRRNARNDEEYGQAINSLKNDIIQNLVDRVLIVKEFHKDEKKHIPATYIDNHIAELMITQFDGDRSKYLAYLRSRGKTQRDFRKDVEEDIIYNYMRSQMRKSQSQISPVKIETYYNENKDKFYQDDAVDLRIIQLNREKFTDAELRAHAGEVRERLVKGEKFEELAKQFSQDARRDRGGDWGWQRRNDLRKEFVDQLFALKKGEYTQPIILPEGAYLLYVNERKMAGIQPIDEVRDQIERIIVTQISREAQEKWLERLRRNGYVKYY